MPGAVENMPEEIRGSIVVMPGLSANVVSHPTEIDPYGMDGLYVEGYIFTDWRLFQKFCFVVQRPLFFFGKN